MRTSLTAVTDEPSPALVATLAAATTGVVGAWLPWSRKLPAGYVDGEPYYTASYTPGSLTGFDLFGGGAAALTLLVTLLTVVGLRRGRSPGPVPVGGGGTLVVVSLVLGRQYRSTGRLAVDWGLPLVGAAGLLFVLVGAWTQARAWGPE
ncbi:MAG: hypothetical protein J07HB67_00769 [halophilic archaeon J07HB67]|nr:MAG: hypothetical protein J07HB67_00769 [halophilic archaeon J07HB67]